MKNVTFHKLISVLLVLSFVCSFQSTVYAAEKENEIVNVEVVEGLAVTEYADGSKCAVDKDGTVYTREKDGTEKQYNPDGTVLSEDTDGNITAYNANGKITARQLSDGTLENWKQIGVDTTVQSFKLDGTMQLRFEGGKGEIKQDQEGNYSGSAYNADGTEFKMSTDENGDNVLVILKGKTEIKISTVTYVDADENGNTVEVGSESTLISNQGVSLETAVDFKTNDWSIKYNDDEGTNINFENGYGSMNFSDGSKYIKSDEGTEYYDAESGDYLLCDADGSIVEGSLTIDGVTHTIDNGKYEMRDSETGGYIIKNSDGSYEVGNTYTGIAYIKYADGEEEFIGLDDEDAVEWVEVEENIRPLFDGEKGFRYIKETDPSFDAEFELLVDRIFKSEGGLVIDKNGTFAITDGNASHPMALSEQEKNFVTSATTQINHFTFSGSSKLFGAKEDTLEFYCHYTIDMVLPEVENSYVQHKSIESRGTPKFTYDNGKLRVSFDTLLYDWADTSLADTSLGQEPNNGSWFFNFNE